MVAVVVATGAAADAATDFLLSAQPEAIRLTNPLCFREGLAGLASTIKILRHAAVTADGAAPDRSSSARVVCNGLNRVRSARRGAAINKVVHSTLRFSYAWWCAGIGSIRRLWVDNHEATGIHGEACQLGGHVHGRICKGGNDDSHEAI